MFAPASQSCKCFLGIYLASLAGDLDAVLRAERGVHTLSTQCLDSG